MHEDLLQFKILMNFVNFPCMIFWVQNVLIATDQNPSYLQTKLSRVFLRVIYILGILEHFSTENYTSLNIAQNLMKFVNFSCMIFWAQNVLIPPNHILLKSFSHSPKLHNEIA